MSQITLPVEKNAYASAKEARRAKQIPMIYYGKGAEPVKLMADYQTFRRTYLKAGRSTLLKLEGKDLGPHLDALVHEVQYDPVTDEITHVDLMVVRKDRIIYTEVPLVFVGESEAVKLLGGVLTTNKDQIGIECLPADLPHNITVDISSLKDFHSSITVGDLVLPKGVKATDAAELSVMSVSAPQKEEAEAPVAVAAPVAEAGAPAPEAAKEGEKAKKE